MQLGPVARLRAAPDGAGEPDLELLRPELFDGAAHPNEVNLRAKRSLLAPLLISGALPGFGEGVDPVEFDEGFDVDRRSPQSVVTPLPLEPGPRILATPDERARIAAELRDAWVTGGFTALPAELRSPTIYEVRAPEGGLNEENFAGFLDDVRGFLGHVELKEPARNGSKERLPRLGDDVPFRGDRRGTVAAVQIGERIYLGVNSSALNDRASNKDPGRIVQSHFQLKMIGNQPWHHAESMALIRAYYDQPGPLPRELTMYIDRDTCSDCKKLLPGVLTAIGVDRVLVVMKSGDRIFIEKGKMRLEGER